MHTRSITMFLCLLALAVSFAPADASPIQWATADGGNDNWYELITSPQQITWQQANAQTASMSYLGSPGYLATVSSAKENAWIYSNVVVSGYAWLGGEDDGSGWRWANGEPWVIGCWSPGQPDGYLGGVQHNLYFAAAPLWDDAPDHWGGVPSQYVVEYNAPVPEPSSLTLLLGGAVAIAGFAVRRFR
jgi:hypothetical protein